MKVYCPIYKKELPKYELPSILEGIRYISCSDCKKKYGWKTCSSWEDTWNKKI